MSALELKIPPPAVALLISAAMWLIARSGTSLDLPLSVRIATLVLFALAGGATALAGDVEFKRAERRFAFGND